MSSLDSTSVNVSWDVLIILDFPIDKYTVIYSQLSQQQNGKEMSAVFLPPATSGVINDLRITDIYQFQVFATVTVDGSPLDGERSAPVNFTRPSKCICHGLTTRYDTKYCVILQVSVSLAILDQLLELQLVSLEYWWVYWWVCLESLLHLSLLESRSKRMELYKHYK